MSADPEKKSRTQMKRQVQDLQKVGERLVTLPPEVLNKIDLPPELREAVLAARSLKKHGARRRQMQYIGTLMRKIDAAPVAAAVEGLQRNEARQTTEFHQLEQLRDDLIDGANTLAEEVLERFVRAERQRLLQLVRNARKEKQEGSSLKAARALFRYLREVAGSGQQ
ncbi:ribosome biogenesis factor YjgA [Thermodesulfobacteriota bacterium]